MMMTMRPASTTVEAGTATCASTLATATAVPGFQTGPAGGLFGQPAGFTADGIDRQAHFLLDDVLQARVEGFEEILGREAFAPGPDGFITGGGIVAGFHAGELPDDPVGGFDQAVGRRVDFRGFIQDLPDFGEEPFRADLARRSGRGSA